MRMISAIFGAVLFCSGSAFGQGAHIVYPVDGASYPIVDPLPGSVSSAYFTASFSVTCAGGPHNVEWGFSGPTAFSPLGNASFYDQTSVQLVYKLPGDAHAFEVNSSCGSDAVKFKIGS